MEIMIASEFIYDNIIIDLELTHPIYLGAGVNINTSYMHVMDVGNVANPAYIRDTYTIKFYGYFERGSYDDGLKDFYKIKDGLLGHPNIIDEDGNIWCRFLQMQGPTFLGNDDKGRSIFTMEFEITVDGNNSTYRKTIQ